MWLPGDDNDPTVAPLRILVAEPDPKTTTLLGRILRGRGYEVDFADSAAAVVAKLDSHLIDVVLLAWSLPGASGLQVLRQVRARYAMPDLPVVLMSSGDESANVVQAFDRGANEFLKKPLDPDVTLVRIHNLVALRRARLALRQQAMVDPLTGIFNRRFIMEHLRTQIAQAERYRRDLAFCLCDIDFFKTVNDTHGHRTGDAALELFAQVLRERLRRSDVIGRFGGDELCIILPETSIEQAVIATEAVRQTIESTPVRSDDGHHCSITASFGVAGLEPETRKVSMLVSRADEALYAAKTAGRNRTCTSRDVEPQSQVRNTPASA